MAVLAGCAGAAVPEAGPPAAGLGSASGAAKSTPASIPLAPETEWPLAVVRRGCGDGASCGVWFLVGNTAASPLACDEPVRPERVSDDVVGKGDAEVRAVVGVDPQLLLAIRNPDCGGIWVGLSVGFGVERKERFLAAVCDALELGHERRTANGCA